jgi:hypothetical protein
MVRFEELWRRHRDFKFSEEEEFEFCPWGRQFYDWTLPLVEKATSRPDLVLLNQAKILLLEKWMEYRAVAPKAHRDHLSRANGHRCLFWAFLNAYQCLKAAELALTPPMLFLPEPAPPPPPPIQVHGIFIGEPE